METIERKYLMRKDEERCDMRYLFLVDDAERITSVELIPSIGIEHKIYERGEDGSLMYQTKTHLIRPSPARMKGEDFRDYIKRRGRVVDNWSVSAPNLVDRLGIGDSIVRDAFNEKTKAGDLFMMYKLVVDSGVHFIN